MAHKSVVIWACFYRYAASHFNKWYTYGIMKSINNLHTINRLNLFHVAGCIGPPQTLNNSLFSSRLHQHFIYTLTLRTIVVSSCILHKQKLDQWWSFTLTRKVGGQQQKRKTKKKMSPQLGGQPQTQQKQSSSKQKSE